MYDVDPDKIGEVASQLSLWCYPFAALSAVAAGYVFDILGRRFTFLSSFYTGCVLLVFVPYTKSVFPSLFLLRIVI